jgi:hypothetical protein
MIIFLMAMLIVMVVRVIVAKKPSTCHIDAKANECDRDCLVIGDGNRINQSVDTFIADQKRDHGEHDRA